ncbi:MAG: hypothetical protein Q8K86_07020 [Candidatus Nanopelagicaceae bacterium]|nr:hypothetical protein [Candidatus Nanopelagicaceae bacterium]
MSVEATILDAISREIAKRIPNVNIAHGHFGIGIVHYGMIMWVKIDGNDIQIGEHNPKQKWENRKMKYDLSDPRVDPINLSVKAAVRAIKNHTIDDGMLKRYDGL